jgi:hypothetical protein
MKRYLLPKDVYMADPSVHIFNGKIFIYPSHDYYSGIPEDDWGIHFDMKDYHVLSIDGDPMTGKVTDHGVVLKREDIPWAWKQLWDCDVQEKNGKYYMYFPAKDKTGIFRCGVAIADKPEGPFVPQPDPIRGSYSIDYAVLKDDDGSYYMYFGGIMGGQLQRYNEQNEAVNDIVFPKPEEPCFSPRIVKMSDDMLQFAEDPRPIRILNPDYTPMKAGDPHHFFEASWMHKYNGKYYYSWSTGDTHLLCYAIGDNPYGPFIFQGELMTPVLGWTTHHSIVEFNGKWYLFHHDCHPSNGYTPLRSLKVCEIEYDEDGKIKTVDGSTEL